MLNCLESVDLGVNAEVKEVVTARMPYAYPIYQQGYEMYFGQIDNWLNNIGNLITFGRQGLFVHDNTHHALHMAYCAVSCLNEDGRFDRAKWQGYRRIFETHVVED